MEEIFESLSDEYGEDKVLDAVRVELSQSKYNGR